MGSCSGGRRRWDPASSHSSKARSCSAKNGLALKSASGCGLSSSEGSCRRHISAAMSQACHMGCWWVGGSLGHDTGVQLEALMMRSASRKFLNKLATSKSWRKSFWNRARGSMFHAMVSVMAVKIQFSSPSGVRRSVCLPGMRSIRSFVSPSFRSRLRLQNHRRATLIGVVRHDVNTSAGSSGFCGSSSFAPQAASRMHSRMGSSPLHPLVGPPFAIPASTSCWRCSAKALKLLTMRPAAEESNR
mmetsp:Transcript_10685/g.32117  ORF Transcript_10685/g.32117 Transcript_10685/m.32117 type:complete len:245 (+) Transcript_10685:301-1035(+)